MITTLAYLFPHTGLGTVTAYPLSPDFSAAWQRLPGYNDTDTGSKKRFKQPPYAGLASALSAVTGQPVVLMPNTYHHVDTDEITPMVAITTDPIDPRLMAGAVRTWERLVRKGDDANMLAPLLSEADIERYELASFVRNSQEGRPVAPGWFYHVATWSFAQRLARKPLTLSREGKTVNVTWRMDTQGSLWSWDLPTHNETLRPKRVGFAMHKLDFRVITLPGEPLFAVHVIPTFTRLATHWARTRTVVLDRGKQALLRLPVGHRPLAARDGDDKPQWEAYPRNFAAEIVQECGLELIDLPSNEELAVLGGSGRVLLPGPQEYPIGKGVGTRFIKTLSEHITDTVKRPRITPVVFTPASKKKLVRPMTGQLRPEDIEHAIRATGYEKVRILVLYSEGFTRKRVSTALAAYTSTPDQPVECADRTDHQLSENLYAHFRRIPAIDSPQPVVWHKELAPLHTLFRDGMLTGALVETVWTPKPTKKQREDKTASHDHKRDLRRSLYSEGVVSQFLARKDPPEPKEEEPTETIDLGSDTDASEAAKNREKKDHPAINATRDLLFRLGAIDHRLPEAVRMDDEAILVGIHLRQQRKSTRTPRGANQTQMVEVLTAVHTSAHPEIPWRTTTYDPTTNDWLLQAKAEAAFGQGPIGQDGHARHEKGAEKVRDQVEAALRTLPTNRPLIIFVDAEACRTIWPGLQHQSLGQGALPGDPLRRNGRSIAVVSVNTSYSEVPVPVENTARSRSTLIRPANPQDYLYRRTSSTGVTTWYIAQASRTYQGFGSDGRVGGLYTRFTLPDTDRRVHLKKDWHGFTAVQFLIADCGGRSEQELATLAAQLCHQSAAWDWRTRHPYPLHVAGAVDRAHPEYRGPSLDDTNPHNE
ncbi:RNaseH domain-containing protein [Nocardiopsis synnemataformans]|uniref:RNaseH domain-containing protein n=1 Tax=Nocardiopsis synnemataformans TaxID=61305 RepID=UPI003EBF856C